MSDLTAQFHAAARAAFQAPLLDRYIVTFPDEDAWLADWSPLRAICFPGGPLGTGHSVYSEAEKATFATLGRTLGSTPLALDLTIRDGDGALVGVMRGSQRNRLDWHMGITAIAPSSQGRGIYSALLRRLLPLMQETGFRQITSRHHADNNAVLVAKLKAGFIVSGFQVTPRRGLMVELTCPLSDGLRRAYGFRIDSLRAGAAELP